MLLLYIDNNYVSSLPIQRTYMLQAIILPVETCYGHRDKTITHHAWYHLTTGYPVGALYNKGYYTLLSYIIDYVLDFYNNYSLSIYIHMGINTPSMCECRNLACNFTCLFLQDSLLVASCFLL